MTTDSVRYLTRNVARILHACNASCDAARCGLPSGAGRQSESGLWREKFGRRAWGYRIRRSPKPSAKARNPRPRFRKRQLPQDPRIGSGPHRSDFSRGRGAAMRQLRWASRHPILYSFVFAKHLLLGLSCRIV
jgi:hypothetical protein